MVVVDREKKTCNIIDIAIPVDAGIVEKEKEKIEKYQDLRREVARLWNVKAKVVPIVVGALGAFTPNLSKHLGPVGQSPIKLIIGNFNGYLFTVKEEFFTRLRFKEKKFVIYNLIELQFCAKSSFNTK